MPKFKRAPGSNKRTGLTRAQRYAYHDSDKPQVTLIPFCGTES